MGVIILVGLVIILAVVGVVAYLLTIYNSLVRLKNDIDKAWANIDVILKQRHDELPKLIETCKGYMKYEQETLEKVVQARNAYSQAQTPQQKAQADNMITGALRTLFAVAEKYPDLKADNNFMELQGRISALEDKIAARRGLFNEDVFAFNTRIASVPDSFVAGFMHLQPHPLFEAAEEDRQDVQVKFT